MEIKYKVGILKNVRYLNGTEADDWYLQYAVRNKQGQDYVQYGGEIDENKDNYPKPIGEESGTIFLDSNLDEIYGYTSIQNVIINSEGPSIIEDKTTRQVLNVGTEQNPTPFIVKLKFNSRSPLDVMELEATCGDLTFIKIHRQQRQTMDIHDCVNKVDLSKNGNEYILTFEFNPLHSSLGMDIDQLLEKLNDNEITIRVFDINANGVEYKTYGEPWKYITSEEDIFDLQKLVIRFSNIIPEDMILAPNIEGECVVTVFNPNSYLWTIQPTIVLNDESIGEIDGDIDFSDYAEHGIAKFKVKRIVEQGNVIVDAWINIDNPKIHDIVYNSTFAEGILGPWLVEDERNRKIKLLDYPPAYLHDRDYWQFVKFTEKFLNTMYTGMNKKTSIGILEKVARIADFNYINDVEAKLLNHYKEHFGIELDPNVDDLRHFLLQKKIALKNEDGEIVANADAYEDMTSDELDNFIRYVYHEIPEYNQYKGSYKGVKMALNMLGLCCKLVELWSKVDNKDVDDLRRADEINDYPLRFDKTEKAAVAKLFLTSRFDVDIEEPSITFREFNSLADNICRLIFQCKPVTRLLRKLSYIYYMWTELRFSYLWFPYYNLQQLHHFKYIFPLATDYVKSKHQYDTNLINDDQTLPENAEDGTLSHWNKIFVNHVANEAYVTYLQNSETKEWKEGVTYHNTYLITRTAVKNAYCNLRNIAYNAKISNIQRLKFNIDYCYSRVLVGSQQIDPDQVYEGGDKSDLSYWYNSAEEVEIPEYHYTNSKYVKNVDTTVAHIADKEDTINVDLPTFDFVEGFAATPSEIAESNKLTIEEAKNGFYLVFNGSTNTFFASKLMPEFLKYGVDTVFYHLEESTTSSNTYNVYKIILHNLDLEIDFDIALGTHFIAQHHDEDITTKFIFPVNWDKENDEVLTSPDSENDLADSHVPAIEPLLAMLGIEGEGSQITYSERSYKILDTDLYKPPVWETVWLNTGWGSVYYLLKKGKSADRHNRDNWLLITDTARNGHYMNPSDKLNEVIPITEDVEVDSNGHPIIIFEHTGNVKESYVSTFKSGFIHRDYSANGGTGSTYAFSDEDDLENPEMFKILDEARNSKGHTVIYRISDMAQHADFGLNNGDGEFAVMLKN